jgi:hypothetical protein
MSDGLAKKDNIVITHLRIHAIILLAGWLKYNGTVEEPAKGA